MCLGYWELSGLMNGLSTNSILLLQSSVCCEAQERKRIQKVRKGSNAQRDTDGSKFQGPAATLPGCGNKSNL